ncbi:hypothetical protein O181_100008 [Austropuccinia psidii MF-1]|uniref:Uncharacterized protein n=1 Tax=Austropuccinia psidii MF-1 TaxID=1389203 RepID=A0A9Q3JDU5_9BASI|nr:hypothetical protein [Austropuccinia psidii MF-1]
MLRVPSRHHLSLCLCSALPTCSQHYLPSLCSRSALPTSSRHCLPSLRLRSALLTCSRHCLPSLRSECPPDMLPTPLMLLMLADCPAPNTTYDPYACVMPSRHCLPSLRSQSALPTCS